MWPPLTAALKKKNQMIVTYVTDTCTVSSIRNAGREMAKLNSFSRKVQLLDRNESQHITVDIRSRGTRCRAAVGNIYRCKNAAERSVCGGKGQSGPAECSAAAK
jgi:hypothetical protein